MGATVLRQDTTKWYKWVLLCPWERHFMTLSPAWWSWQAVLNYSHISIKVHEDSNILASPKAGWGNCLPYILASLCFPVNQENKYRDKIKKIIIIRITIIKMLYLLSHITDKLLVRSNYTGTEKHKITKFSCEKIISILAF